MATINYNLYDEQGAPRLPGVLRDDWRQSQANPGYWEQLVNGEGGQTWQTNWNASGPTAPSAAYRDATYQDFGSLWSGAGDPNSALYQQLATRGGTQASAGTPSLKEIGQIGTAFTGSMGNGLTPSGNLDTSNFEAMLRAGNYTPEQMEAIRNQAIVNMQKDDGNPFGDPLESIIPAGVIATLAYAFGGAGLDAMGAGAGSASGGATAATGAGAAEGLAGYESLVGPLTGTIESAPVIGAAGAPVVSGVASGAGPFVPTFGTGLTGLAGAASQFLSPVGSNGSATPDWMRLVGAAIPGVVGAYASGQQADALRDISAASRADRAPYLQASQNYLANPTAYAEGPGKAQLDAVLRKLSAGYGNPIDSPTALGIATQAGLSDWRNAVTQFGNLGLAGEDTRAQVDMNAVRADAGVYNGLGAAAADVFNPQRSIYDFLKDYRKAGLA